MAQKSKQNQGLEFPNSYYYYYYWGVYISIAKYSKGKAILKTLPDEAKAPNILNYKIDSTEEIIERLVNLHREEIIGV